MEEHRKNSEEFWRKRKNPTPEEQAELDEQIKEEMDKKFAGWPGYIPRGKVKIVKPECSDECQQKSREILGVSSDASCKEIGSKYRLLSKKLHPDKNDTKEAEAELLSVNEAYEAIC
jgi:DnaJ-domain-containing protein 1